MKELTIEQATQANGTAPLADAPPESPPLTPDQRLTAFQQDLTAIMERYGIRLGVVAIGPNTGAQHNPIDFLPGAGWQLLIVPAVQ